MYKIAYNANGLRTIPLEDGINAVAEAGYAGIELSLHPAHLDPFSFTPADAERLRKVIERAGITACALATGADDLLSEDRFEPSLIHPTEDGRARRLDVMRRAMDIATWLQIPVMSFASGLRKPEVSTTEADQLLREGIERCLDIGADVVLAMEPEPGFHYESNKQVAQLIDAVGDDRLRLNQDLGHCRVVEDHYLESVERHLAVTSHIHVEDIKGRVHYHEIPGDGDIDFDGFGAALIRGGYDGFLSVELYNHADVYSEALQRSYRHLTGHLAATAGT
ncbi:MAG: sugar phosphate isomerase/epimerase family protein [Pseudonocardiaceae bacterium]